MCQHVRIVDDLEPANRMTVKKKLTIKYSGFTDFYNN